MKAIELETDKHALALLELDILTDDLEFHDRYEKQKEDIRQEKQRLEQMEQQHKELENNLSNQIQRLVFNFESLLRQLFCTFHRDGCSSQKRLSHFYGII